MRAGEEVRNLFFVHAFLKNLLPGEAIDYLQQYRNTTIGEVYRKIMGDAPLAYVETVGAVRVSEDDIVAVGKNDVGYPFKNRTLTS